ncbi:unnamed protein product [Fraxinus pennsylvanica]|uniref:Uncharacterized protein n=1 Tax=Fraxinus pennsylvanica TaxID=56036 RepID=A0AAD1ZME4_9LAMI|nr:unnamed protein product [Fraxinus pennsylvanica]
MVSLPDSTSSIDQSTGQDDELEFHTPPEQRFTSSEDQTVDCAVGEPTAVDLGCTGCGAGKDDQGEGTSGSGFVELKKNKVPDWGFSQNSLEKKPRVSEDSDSECESENEFVEKNDPIVIEVLSDSEREELDENIERANMAVDSPMKISIAEKGEVLKNGESNEGDKNGDVNKNCKPGEISEANVLKIYEGEKAHKNGDGEGRPDSAKNAEEIEKFKYVPSAAVDGRKGKERVGGGGVSVNGKRELPPSMKGKEKNVRGEEVVGKARTKNGVLMDLLEVLKVEKAVVGDADSTYEEDVDFLETAKRRGLTFPKPRWWPPNGFQE